MSHGLQTSAYTEIGSGKWDTASKFLGPIDLHYHFRTKPLFRFFARLPESQPIRIFEYGCGPGANLINLKAFLPHMEGVGLDISQLSIDVATRASARAGCQGLRFSCSESLEGVSESEELFDYILLIDVLEHLDHPEDVVTQLGAMLKPGGQLLISVPTPRYPRVLGREFHEAVGHVRDGFTLEDLSSVIGPSYERMETSYNTGLLASFACFLFYRVVPKIRSRKVVIFGTLGLHVFRLLDWVNGAKVSASLWAAFKKKP